MARGRDLHRRGRWQVSGRGVHAERCDRSQRRISARHAVYAPTDGGVSCVGYRRREGRLATEHNRSARWLYGHFYCWGGGGGGGELPAPQPNVHAPSARSAMTTIVVVLDFFPLLRERDRMPSQKQAKGQRKKGKQGTRIRQTVLGNSSQETAWNQQIAAFPTPNTYRRRSTRMILAVSSRPNFVLIWNRTRAKLFHIGTTSPRKFLR